MKPMIWLLLVVGFAANASDYPDWQVSGDTLLKGDFSQQKKTKHLRRPIRSGGTILISPKHGIAWQTIMPVKSTMVITNNQIVTIDSQGNKKKISGSNDINTIFSNALTGNWSVLKEHFELSFINDGTQQHCVFMLPKSELIKKTFKQMSACGDKQRIKELLIEEVSGGTTQINLSLALYPALDEAEKLLFANE